MVQRELKLQTLLCFFLFTFFKRVTFKRRHMGPAKGFLHSATFSQSFLLLPQLKAEAKKGILEASWNWKQLSYGRHGLTYAQPSPRVFHLSMNIQWKHSSIFWSKSSEFSFKIYSSLVLSIFAPLIKSTLKKESFFKLPKLNWRPNRAITTLCIITFWYLYRNRWTVIVPLKVTLE